MKNDAWSAAARHPATVWAQLGLVAELVALKLVVALDANNGPVPGRLDALIALVMRGSVRGRERKNFRAAIDKARDAGLIFEHEGQVYVLYSETQWRRHRALGEQVAREAREALVAVAPPPSPPPPAPEPIAVVAPPPSNTNAETDHTSSASGGTRAPLRLVAASQADPERAVSEPLVRRYCYGQLELSSGNHSGQVLGERERERETETTSPLRERDFVSLSDATPTAPRPGASLPKLKRAREKKPRKASPFALCREQLAALFGTLYEAAYPGRRSLPRRQDVWTTVTKAYLLPDGALNTGAAEQSIRAFLAARWWVGEGRPGHSFDGWANNHERYDALLQTRSANQWDVNYAF